MSNISDFMLVIVLISGICTLISKYKKIREKVICDHCKKETKDSIVFLGNICCADCLFSLIDTEDRK